LDLQGLWLKELPAGLDKLDAVTTLDISSNSLTTLKGLPKNLIILVCECNRLTTLDYLPPNLKILSCRYNKITSLGNLPSNLTELYCADNEITSVKDLPSNLVELNISNNRISSLEGLPSNLLDLKCKDNQIISLTGLPLNLRTLKCENNQIVSLEGLQFLRLLRWLSYENNPVQHIPPHIERFLHRVDNIYAGQIYNDNQNVHNSSISRTAHQSISNLLSEFDKFALKGVILRDSIVKSSLDDKLKARLFEYFDIQDVHSILLINFEEIFAVVWYFIQSQSKDRKIELYQRLTEEMEESECKCFTGRMTRLVNTLNGYTDLVRISISDREQCSNIMSLLLKQGLADEVLKVRFVEECQEREISKELMTEFFDEI